MTPEQQRRRAGRAVEDRMAELGITIPMLARKAGVDPTTVRALLRGRRWPRATTRAKIAAVLGWRLDDLIRIAVDGPVSLEAIPTRELLKELCRRADGWGDGI
jgi:transcriptional regulator with XRE-family HTH domain